MKSYWIAATIFLLGTWPSGSTAYAAGVGQSPAVEKPAQQAQSSNTSAAPQETGNDALKTTQPAVTTAPAAPAASAQNAQNKGSYLLVELSKSLKAKKLKPGDKIKAEVAQDVVSHGKVIIPVETELVGHVTEVSVRDDANPESRLGIVFDRILLKHYHDVNFQAVVQAVAPPVVRKSRVDQPSQMLPPSMVAGSTRDSGASPIGRSNSPVANRGQVSPSSSAAMSTANSINLQAPLTVKQSPTNSAASGTSAAQLDVGPGGKPMSIGMPQGVTGIKGLSLSSGPTASTPGPLIISTTDNVKLESGTQILLHVLSVETPSTENKK
jgi:hypothetical protein